MSNRSYILTYTNGTETSTETITMALSVVPVEEISG